jgi:drug/metabolite transporter (DMT)-like permease
VAFAFSTVLQQGSARSTALRHAAAGHSHHRSWLPVVRLFDRLLRDRTWMLGWAFGGAGFICHAVALHLGAIAVIQSVLVSQLMFSLLISARLRNLRPTARDWFGAAAICIGIVTMVLLRGEVGQHTPSRGSVAVYAVIILVAIATLLAVARAVTARRPHTQARTALVAIASGMSFSGTATCMVLLTGDIAERGLPGLFGAPVLGVAMFSVIGTLLVQDAFASGSLPTAVATMTITDPVCSATVGAVLFDAAPPGGWVLFVGLPLCAALVATGVILLATSTTLHDERHLHPPVVSEEWSATSSQTVRSQG